MTTATTDRIEKSIDVRAPRSRVWRALIHPDEFRRWFGFALDRPFASGATVRATIVGTEIDEEVAKAQRNHAGLTFDILVEAVEPEHRLAFRWHPGAVAEGVDYSTEPTTLVEFLIEDIPSGTRIRVIESGFDGLSLERRARAFAGNEQGWTIVVDILSRFVDHVAP